MCGWKREREYTQKGKYLMKIATWSHSQIKYGSQVKGEIAIDRRRERKNKPEDVQMPCQYEHVSFALI